MYHRDLARGGANFSSAPETFLKCRSGQSPQLASYRIPVRLGAKSNCCAKTALSTNRLTNHRSLLTVR